MNNSSNKDGFTLIEILVAVAIIAVILSMVYGSYFATSKSTQIYKARIALFQQGRKVLGQMARQIRCSHADYFNGDPDAQSGEILHLVTTNGIFVDQEPTDGLFKVIYKFDKSKGLLSLSQTRFVGTSEGLVKKREWQPIADNIDGIELTFFDGQKWLNKWEFKDKKKLPCAVKIEISSQDENYQRYHYGTIAHIYCQENQGKKSRTDVLVSIDK